MLRGGSFGGMVTSEVAEKFECSVDPEELWVLFVVLLEHSPLGEQSLSKLW